MDATERVPPKDSHFMLDMAKFWRDALCRVLLDVRITGVLCTNTFSDLLANRATDYNIVSNIVELAGKLRQGPIREATEGSDGGAVAPNRPEQTQCVRGANAEAFCSSRVFVIFAN